MSQDTVPKEGRVLSLLLHSCGITECEPKVISALQEYSYGIPLLFLTYTTVAFSGRLLASSAKYAEIAGRDTLDPSDVKIASSKMRLQTSRPNTRDYYLEVMSKINSKPLPPPLTSGPYGLPLNDDESRSASFRITALRG